MIDREHPLPISRQAQLLDISRGMVYYQPKPISPRDQLLMKRIDRLLLELPFAGARILRDLLRQEGHKVGRSKVSRLMRLMGVERHVYHSSINTPASSQQVRVILVLKFDANPGS